MTKYKTLFSAFFLVILTNDLFACAVCSVGEDESTQAFMISTAILTFVPLTLILGIGAYIYSKIK